MGQVVVTVNGRKYDIACDNGQEAHLTNLSQYIDKCVAGLVAVVGQIGDARLLVMASLLIADELSEVYPGLDHKNGATDRGTHGPLVGPDLERLAERIENIAANLERA